MGKSNLSQSFEKKCFLFIKIVALNFAYFPISDYKINFYDKFDVETRLMKGSDPHNFKGSNNSKRKNASG